MDREIEIWKDVPGYEGLYQASDFGRIKSLERTIYKVMNGGGIHGYKRRERILNQYNNNDYLIVRLSKDGLMTNCYAHILVADSFIPNPMNLPEINHEDGNKQNNNLYNLKRVTASENQLHAYRMGLQVAKFGEDHHRSKLSNEDVNEIRKLVDAGFFQIYVAKRFNVSASLVNTIVKRKHRVYG